MENSEELEKLCDLPFSTEYAKSGRSTCKSCRGTISEGTLRISAREPSRYFDGVQDNWFHCACFFKKLRPLKDNINERSIRGIEHLRWNDQEMIRDKIAAFLADKATGVKIGGPMSYGFYYGMIKAEYSKTNRGKCTCCKGFFNKDELKLCFKSCWYHTNCLIGKINFTGIVDAIQGFKELKQEDQDMLKKETQPEPKAEPVEEKKPIVLDDPTIVIIGEVKVETKTTTTTTTYDDCEIITIEPSKSEIASKRVSEAAPAVVELKKPKIEVGMTDKQKKALKKQTELWWQLREGFENNLSKSDMIVLLKANSQVPPNDQILDLLVDCALFGNPAPCPKCPNGQIVFSLSRKTYVCLGYMSEYTKCSYTNENPVRSPFEIPFHLINANSWLGTLRVNLLTKRTYPESDSADVVKREDLNSFKYLGARSMKAAECYTHGQKSGHEQLKPKQYIKNGTVVDGECEYAEVSHVHRDPSGGFYMCTLGVSDLVRNVNSYYKMQLLRHDVPTVQNFYLFRSWGRTGTSVGGKLTDILHSEEFAVEAFKNLFYEKTGNAWDDRQYFHKKPGMHGLIDMDYSEVEKTVTNIVPGTLNKLHPSIANIMNMICDINQMEVVMKEYELDLNKMPLGKLSKRQITQAYKVLTELQTLISDKNNCNDAILDATNRFYTLIPHNFGMASPEPLSSVAVITKKCAMLESLLEIVEAMAMLKSDADNTENLLRDPVDVHYEKLHCRMEYVPPTDKEYIIIQRYLSDTHGKTHSHYKLKLKDVIKIDREGEGERFHNLGNRMLLWHGSPTSNYVGILSKGLRIAPPEAPSSGYMFGKGIYFADMCSKSANYARVRTGPALILLCDVALGRVQDEVQAFPGGKALLKSGFNSVKGNGSTYLDPKFYFNHPDGYVIPLGKQQTNNQTPFSLLYNEYIVYDVNQVRLKYLLHVDFS